MPSRCDWVVCAASLSSEVGRGLVSVSFDTIPLRFSAPHVADNAYCGEQARDTGWLGLIAAHCHISPIRPLASAGSVFVLSSFLRPVFLPIVSSHDAAPRVHSVASGGSRIPSAPRSIVEKRCLMHQVENIDIGARTHTKICNPSSMLWRCPRAGVLGNMQAYNSLAMCN